MRGTLKHLNLKFHWHEKVSVTPPNRLRSLTAFSVPLLPTAHLMGSPIDARALDVPKETDFDPNRKIFAAVAHSLEVGGSPLRYQAAECVD